MILLVSFMPSVAMFKRTSDPRGTIYRCEAAKLTFSVKSTATTLSIVVIRRVCKTLQSSYVSTVYSGIIQNVKKWMHMTSSRTTCALIAPNGNWNTKRISSRSLKLAKATNFSFLALVSKILVPLIAGVNQSFHRGRVKELRWMK